jgi:hypothetical protein
MYGGHRHRERIDSIYEGVDRYRYTGMTVVRGLPARVAGFVWLVAPAVVLGASLPGLLGDTRKAALGGVVLSLLGDLTCFAVTFVVTAVWRRDVDTPRSSIDGSDPAPGAARSPCRRSFHGPRLGCGFGMLRRLRPPQLRLVRLARCVVQPGQGFGRGS